MPHSAQPGHTNDWAPRTRKQHQQEHRPQRPTERSDPTQHAKGRTGDCPGPCKGTATRRNVTRGVGGGMSAAKPSAAPTSETANTQAIPHAPRHNKCFEAAPLHQSAGRGLRGRCADCARAPPFVPHAPSTPAESLFSARSRTAACASLGPGG